MKVTIQKWGNSLGLRIPSVVAKDLSLENGSEVELLKESDRIVIRPSKEYRLEDLLEGITDANLHREVDSGSAQGNESW